MFASRTYSKLNKVGFEGPFAGGKHDYMKRKNFRLTVLNPHSKDIDSVLIKEILRQANIDVEEWLSV